jgi:hypothetical protein
MIAPELKGDTQKDDRFSHTQRNIAGLDPRIRRYLNVTARFVGPNAPPGNICIVVLTYICFGFTAPLSLSLVLGSWRYALPYWLSICCYCFDFFGMIWLSRSCPESTPWLHIEEHGSARAFDGLFEHTIFSIVLVVSAFSIFSLTFVYHEVDRRDLDPPGVAFYFMTLLSYTLVATIHMATDNLIYEFMGQGIQHEQRVFAEKIRVRSIDFETAMKSHRKFNTKQRNIVSKVSLELNIFVTLVCIAAFSFCYEYFVMPHSHWGHLANFIFFVVMCSIILPFSWGPVNENQDALRILVAESVGKEVASDNTMPAETLESKHGKEEEELWDAAKRAQFLIHIQNTEYKCRVFGWEVGPPFIMEIGFLFASTAFLLWQVTQLSGWQGFSFDKGTYEESSS